MREKYTYTDIEKIADGLGKISPQTVITGVHEENGICTYTAKNGKITEGIKKPMRDGVFYGAGDIFASVFGI